MKNIKAPMIGIAVAIVAGMGGLTVLDSWHAWALIILAVVGCAPWGNE